MDLELLKDKKTSQRLIQFVPDTIRDMVRRLIRQPLETLQNCPDLFLIYRRLHEHPQLERKPGGWVYKGSFYPDYLTVGGASHAIWDMAGKYCKGVGVDIGAGYWPLPGSMPVDLSRGPGLGHVLSDFEDESLNYIFSSHCLEHISDYRKALIEWTAKIRKGGILFLYLPHPSCAIWHPGSPFVGDGHKWIPELSALKKILLDLRMEVVLSEEGPDFMRSFFICCRKKE